VLGFVLQVLLVVIVHLGGGTAAAAERAGCAWGDCQQQVLYALRMGLQEGQHILRLLVGCGAAAADRAPGSCTVVIKFGRRCGQFAAQQQRLLQEDLVGCLSNAE
jgi:hypothetical protein